MEEERVYNELSHASGGKSVEFLFTFTAFVYIICLLLQSLFTFPGGGSVGLTTPSDPRQQVSIHRTRTVSSPVPVMPGPSPQGMYL